MEEWINPNRKPRNTRNKTEDISHLLYGKVPPQARELEEAVLGAIMIEKDTINEVGAILAPEVFYVDAHATIYRAIIELFVANQPIDLLTVTEKLRKNEQLENVGGAFYLSELTNKVASSANVEHHSKIIFQKFMQREVIRSSNDAIRDGYEDTTDPFDLVDNTISRLQAVRDRTQSTTIQIASSVMRKTMVEMKETHLDLLTNPDKILGIPSGIKLLDDKTDGFMGPDLVIIAAGAGEGKSTFGLQVARNSAETGNPTGLFLMEMKAKQIVWKMFSTETGVPIKEIRRGNLTVEQWQRLDELYEKYLNCDNLYFYEEGSMYIEDFCSVCRSMKHKLGLKMVVADYLQLFTAKGEKGNGIGNREQEVNYISKKLKRLAMELNIPVIALSQLNRIVQNKNADNKRMYQLSDLRESGSIEQDADIVIFLFSPEYHQIKRLFAGEPEYKPGDLEMFIAKMRLDGPDRFLLFYDRKYSKIRDKAIDYDRPAFLDAPLEKPTAQNPLFTDHGKSSSDGGVRYEDNDDLPF